MSRTGQNGRLRWKNGAGGGGVVRSEPAGFGVESGDGFVLRTRHGLLPGRVSVIASQLKMGSSAEFGRGAPTAS